MSGDLIAIAERLREALATLRFGEPMRLSQAALDESPLAHRTFVDALMYQICHLSGQEYLNEYAGRRPKPAFVAA